MSPLGELLQMRAHLIDDREGAEDLAFSGDRRLASVALVLRPAGDSPDILLIRRAEWEQDPWSGQMAFPGGRHEEQDASLLQTAVRETREETGIQLREAGETLGRLEPVVPGTPRLPDLSIVPFVFAVPPDTPAIVASPEVAEVHWVPLRTFRDPASRSAHRLEVGDGELVFPAFDIEGRVVWGLTHRILSAFLDRWPS